MVLDSGDLDGGNRGTRQRGQQDTPQRIAQRRAIAPFQRLYDIFAVRVISGILDAFDTRLLDFYHIVLPSFLLLQYS